MFLSILPTKMMHLCCMSRECSLGGAAAVCCDGPRCTGSSVRRTEPPDFTQVPVVMLEERTNQRARWAGVDATMTIDLLTVFKGAAGSRSAGPAQRPRPQQ